MTTVPYVQIGEGPDLYSLPVYNASTSTDIDANVPVIIDTSNLLDAAGTNNQIAVTTPGAAASNKIVGITRTKIPALGEGRMVPLGPVLKGVCDVGGVAAGAQVTNGTTSPYTALTAAAAASAGFGVALVSGASGEEIAYVATYIAYAHS